MKRSVLTLILVACIALNVQAYPSRPLTVIVPFNAGGSVDSMTRVVCEFMKKELKKPMTILNQPGAGAAIGVKKFLQTKADGHTILALPTALFYGPAFKGRPVHDTTKFKPIGAYIKPERMLFARPDAPYKDYAQLVDYARKNPGKLKFGSGGSPDTAYVFKLMAIKENLKINYTAFNGGSPAAAAILGKHVDLIEGGVGSPADAAARAGKLSPLAILTTDPGVDHFPGIKNPYDLGYAYASSQMIALFMHAADDPAQQKVLSQALARALDEEKLKSKFSKRGIELKYFSPEAVARSIDTSRKLVDKYLENR